MGLRRSCARDGTRRPFGMRDRRAGGTMAGLRLRGLAVGRSAASSAHHPARLSPGFCPVPPVRHLEALAGVLGGPEIARRFGRDGRRYDRRSDGGLAGHGRAGIFCWSDVLRRPPRPRRNTAGGGARQKTQDRDGRKLHRRADLRLADRNRRFVGCVRSAALSPTPTRPSRNCWVCRKPCWSGMAPVSEEVARAMVQGALVHSTPIWRSLLPASPVRAVGQRKNRSGWCTSPPRAKAEKLFTANAASAISAAALSASRRWIRRWKCCPR